MRSFVDSNVFLRLFTEEDNPGQINQARKLLERARDGDIELVTGPPVMFEIAWTLAVRHKISGSDVLDILEAILSFPNLKVADRELVMEAIDLARETRVGFADCYIAAEARHVNADNIATFNGRHFKKLETHLLNFEEL